MFPKVLIMFKSRLFGPLKIRLGCISCVSHSSCKYVQGLFYVIVKLKLWSSPVFMFACVVSLFLNVIVVVVLLFMPTLETFAFVAFTAVIFFYCFLNIIVNGYLGFGASYFSLLSDATVEGFEFPKGLLNFFVVPFEYNCFVRFPITVVRASILSFMGSFVTYNLSSWRLLNLGSASFIRSTGSVMSPFSQLYLLQTTNVGIQTLEL